MPVNNSSPLTAAHLLPSEHPGVQVDGGAPRGRRMVHRVQKVCGGSKHANLSAPRSSPESPAQVYVGLHTAWRRPAAGRSGRRYRGNKNKAQRRRQRRRVAAAGPTLGPPGTPGPALNACTLSPRALQQAGQPGPCQWAGPSKVRAGAARPLPFKRRCPALSTRTVGRPSAPCSAPSCPRRWPCPPGRRRAPGRPPRGCPPSQGRPALCGLPPHRLLRPALMALLKESAAAFPSGRAKRKDKWVCSDQARGKGLGGAMQHAAPPLRASTCRTCGCRLAAESA